MKSKAGGDTPQKCCIRLKLKELEIYHKVDGVMTLVSSQQMKYLYSQRLLPVDKDKGIKEGERVSKVSSFKFQVSLISEYYPTIGWILR